MHGDLADTLYALSDVTERLAVAEQYGRPMDFWEQARKQHESGSRSFVVAGGIRSVIDAGVRTLTDSALSSFVGVAQPELHQFQRRLVVRDLIPAQPMTTYSQVFVRELNPVATEGGVSGVAEAAAKPEDSANVTFAATTVIPGTLAVTLDQVSKQLLDDAPNFLNYLRTQRLPYKMRVREEHCFLFGGGTTAEAGITGIANTSGVSTAGSASLQVAITDGRKATADVADAVVVNKNDYATAYDANPAYFGYLDIPVVQTTAVPSGTAIIGSWASGALILDREDVTVEILDQHSDNASKNARFVRCEERVGFYVSEPQSFAVRTF